VHRGVHAITLVLCPVMLLRVTDFLGADWPRFRHPSRPEFLLTLPHRHGTSGFFVARVRRPYD